jgi:uncharacterized protein YjbI with pentapeptide repeats
MAEKPDPFDVAPLESALNDSATRVSTIWISYLIFALYLLIATGMTTHQQLFLGEPLKLPVLNIDLPLFWFYILAPILFVLFHFYVLLQVLLLGRTAAAYNETINRVIGPTRENALMRQRLANTLFAQIFAGSPREREGWLGWLLRAIAWITLALAPIYIILAFQIVFLPYHSHLATWTHRLLLLIELAVAFLLWPLAFDARKDFSWRKLWRRIELTTVIPVRLLSAKKERRREWQRLRLQAVPVAACTSFVAISLGLASFPGEPHINLFTGNSPFTVQCDRWISQNFDRLVLPNADVIDDEKLAKIEKATAAKGRRPSEGERTRSFRKRDLTCGTFNSADLRRADFAGARMSGANFELAELRGANFSNAQLQSAKLSNAELQEADLNGAQLQGVELWSAQLQGADLNHARLQGADLRVAWLQGADLRVAWLQGANLGGAQLQGADLINAQLQGAELREAQLQGAMLGGAQLQGAGLSGAHLQGADLNGVQLQGADLSFAELQGAGLGSAQLQGADLTGAQLQGADLLNAQLQGAELSNSHLKLARIFDVYLWRARHANCSDARVISPKFQVVFGTSYRTEIRATPQAIEMFIESAVSEVGGDKKDEVRKRLNDWLVATMQEDELAATETNWSDCASNSKKVGEPEYVKQHAGFLLDLACSATINRKEIAAGIAQNWIFDNPRLSDFSFRLARGLLGLDGKQCAATNDLTEETKDRLREIASVRTPAN